MFGREKSGNPAAEARPKFLLLDFAFRLLGGGRAPHEDDWPGVDFIDPFRP
jgi:hypothetical protein